MGFTTTVLILSPSHDPCASNDCILWRVSEVLNVGYSYRQLEVLTSAQDSHISTRVDTKGRAGVTWFSEIYLPLCTHLRTGDVRKIFAPPFIIPKEHGSGFFYDSFDKQIALLPPESQRVLPHVTWVDGGTFPSEYKMRVHNNTLASKNLETVRRKHTLILGSPMIWVSCRTMASWTETLLKENSSSGKQLRFDREAKARVESWHGMFRAYAKLHARALFVHEKTYWV